jgi:hypothetical protein
MSNRLSFFLSKIHQIFSQVGLLLFDSRTETSCKFSTLHQDKTFTLLGLDLLDNVTVPFLKTLHDLSDAIDVGIFLLPV